MKTSQDLNNKQLASLSGLNPYALSQQNESKSSQDLTLTDKIIEAKDTNPTAKVLFVSDVKEHIKILKEKLKKTKEFGYPIVAIDNTFEIINEVFGDKLI